MIVALSLVRILFVVLVVAVLFLVVAVVDIVVSLVGPGSLSSLVGGSLPEIPGQNRNDTPAVVLSPARSMGSKPTKAGASSPSAQE